MRNLREIRQIGQRLATEVAHYKELAEENGLKADVYARAAVRRLASEVLMNTEESFGALQERSTLLEEIVQKKGSQLEVEPREIVSYAAINKPGKDYEAFILTPVNAERNKQLAKTLVQKLESLGDSATQDDDCLIVYKQPKIVNGYLLSTLSIVSDLPIEKVKERIEQKIDAIQPEQFDAAKLKHFAASIDPEVVDFFVNHSSSEIKSVYDSIMRMKENGVERLTYEQVSNLFNLDSKEVRNLAYHRRFARIEGTELVTTDSALRYAMEKDPILHSLVPKIISETPIRARYSQLSGSEQVKSIAIARLSEFKEKLDVPQLQLVLDLETPEYALTLAKKHNMLVGRGDGAYIPAFKISVFLDSHRYNHNAFAWQPLQRKPRKK